ncbi:hypothetical protein HJC23_000388, partial [Cyclotella cryptica]
MRFIGFAIGALLHSQPNHKSYVDAFSIPKVRPYTSVAKNAPNGNDVSVRSLAKLRANTPIVSKSSGRFPEDFDSHDEVHQHHPEDVKFKDRTHREIFQDDSINLDSDLPLKEEQRTQNGFLAGLLGVTPALYASKTWAYVGSAMGFAGAVLANVVTPDVPIGEGNRDYAPDNIIISKLAVHDSSEFSSGATRPSAISSSLNIMADGSALEETESIVGNLLEKAIDDIDKQMAAEDKLKAQKQKAMEEEERVRETQARAELEAKAQQEKIQTEARKAEEKAIKEEAEAKAAAEAKAKKEAEARLLKQEQETQAAEEAKLKAQQEKLKEEQEKKAAEEARVKAEQEKKLKEEQEKKAAEEARIKAEQDKKLKEDQEKKAAEEARLKAEQEK